MSPSQLDDWFLAALAVGGRRPADVPCALTKLTVVIVSYERQDFLLRQAVYWGNGAAKVVIVDGSSRPLSGLRLEALLTQKNITYLHLPESLSVRMGLAAQHVHTLYAVLLGDDEFLLKKGLSMAIKKLEQDPTLVACMGQSLGFYPSSDGAHCTYTPGYPHLGYEVTHDDVRQRLAAAMTNYTPVTSYAVVREPVWSRSWGAIHNWSSPYVGELQQAITTYIWGKLSAVDEIYWMRSYESLSINIENEHDVSLSTYDWYSSPRFQSERDDFVETLAGELVSAEQFGYPEARNIVLEAIESYLAFYISRRNVRRGVALFTRGLIARGLERVLPERRFLALKVKLFGPLRPKEKVNLVMSENATSESSTESVLIDPETASEIAEIEVLVSGFYRARLSEERA